MDIYLDDEAVAVVDAETLTVQQLAQQIGSRLSDVHRLLTMIRCDGRDVGSGELDGTLAKTAGSYRRIEFQSSDIGELVRSALAGATELFDQSDRNRFEAANLLNEGQNGKAMRVLGECFAAWAQAHESVAQSSRLLKVDLGKVDADGLDVGEWLGLLREKLRELKQALEVSDHVLVADILKYEFDDISEKWKRIAAHLSKMAATA